MPAIFHPDGGFISPVFFDKVVLTQVGDNGTSTRVLTGQAVGGFYADGTSYETVFAQLVATAYLRGVSLNPQPEFVWESSNPDVCSVDQNGNCNRVTNSNTATYDSDGCDSKPQVESFIGGATQITATACRPDGSPSGVRGIFNLVVQAQAFRQFGGVGSMKASASLTHTPNAYNLVASSQPPSDQSA